MTPGTSSRRARAAALAALAFLAAAIAPSLAQAAPPPNDDFADAEVLSGPLPITATGTNAEATLEPGEPTGYPGGASVWYRWTPSTSAPATIDLCSSDFDTVMAIYTGEELLNLTLEWSDDDGCGTFGAGSKATITSPTAGTTYWIAVDGFSGATGSISLEVRQPNPPANDDLADAEEVTGDPPILVTGNNLEASKEPGEPDHAGARGGASVWYRWTPAASGRVEIDDCGGQLRGSPLAVYTGSSVGSLTEVSSGNTNSSCGAAGGTRVEFTATAGETYRIAVDGSIFATAVAAQGTIGLTINLVPPPENDDFPNSRLLGGDLPIAVSGTNAGATKEAGEPDHAGNPGGASVWYRWAPVATGPVTIDTCASQFNTLLGVYSGSAVDGLSTVAGDDDGCGAAGAGSRVTFTAVAGQTYRIAVDGFRSGEEVARGSIALAIRRSAEPPPNDDFANAEMLSGALPIDASGNNLGATKEGGEPDHAGNPGGASVWYRWTSDTDGQVTIDTCGGDLDSLLAVYTGQAVGGLAPVATDDDGCGPGAGSTITFVASAGETYRIAVDGWSPPTPAPATGQVVLRIERGDGRPPNDDFANAAPLSGTLPIDVGGTNLRATKEPGEPDHAGGGGAASVWYHWRATEDRPVTVDVCGAFFDTLLAVYTGSALDELTVVEARDQSFDFSASEYRGCQVSFRASAGETYRIAVDGPGSLGSRAASAHRLTIREAHGPLNDDFANAKPLSTRIPVEMTGHNVEATEEPGEPDHGGDRGGASVWYRWTPSVSGPVTVGICDTFFDNLLAVYTGPAVGELNLVASNAFGCEVGFRANAGETYRIAVDGFRDASGAIARGDLTLELRRSNPPANDDFAEAEVLGGPLPLDAGGTNVDATKTAVEPNHDGSRGGSSVWYRWTAAASGTVAIDLCDSSFDTVLGVYTGSAEGTLSKVASNDDGCGGRGSRATFAASAGTTYRIAVDGFFGSQGSIALRIVEPSAAGATAGCAPGERALGGGAGSIGPTAAGTAHRHTIQASGPIGATGSMGDLVDGDVARGWGASVANHTTAQQLHKVLAICSATADATIELTSLEVPANGVAEGLATCPAGTRAVGGGIATPETEMRQRHTVQASAPVNESGQPSFTDSGDVARSWFTSMVNHTDSAQTYRVYALCSPSSEATIMAELFSGGIGEVAEGAAICPTGQRALGGGVSPLTTGPEHLSTVQASAPVDTSLSIAGSEDGEVPKAWYGSMADRRTALFGETPYRSFAICSPASDATIATAPLTAPPSGPQHDDFDAAHALDGSLPLKVTGTTRGATKEPGEPDHAGDPGGASVWYRWTATEDGPVTVETCGSDFDTALGVYTGSAVDELSEVAGEEVACGSQSRVTFAASAGQTYRIAIDGGREASGSPATGSIVLRAQGTEPPPNDDLEAAKDLTGPLPIETNGHNLLATEQPGEPDHAGNPGGASVWYRWTAATDGPVAIDTCGGDFDSALGVYTGSAVGGLSEVAGNDDACGTRSRLAFRANAGETYRIAVDGQRSGSATAATGSIVLRIRTAHPPLNDDLADAETLEGDLPIVIEGANFDATRETTEASHGGPGGASTWYRWTPSASGRVAIETCGVGIDTLLGVYRGGLTAVGTDDNACAPQSRVLVDASVGEAYLIAVDGRRSAWGTFTLRIEPVRLAPPAPELSSTAPASPANDNNPKVLGHAPGAQTVRLYADSPTCTGEADWTGTVAELEGAGIAISVADDSRTEIRARAIGAQGDTSECSEPIAYVEDSTAPPAPTLASTRPASPANDNRPRVTGNAEPGSTVALHANESCAGSPSTSGAAAALTSPGLTLAVADSSMTEITARAVDAAGNASECSNPIEYVESSVRKCAGKAVTVAGTAADDVITGSPFRDVIAARGGDDVVRGLRGNDLVCGGRGDDTIRGGGGSDVLRGGPGRDVLIGGRGSDKLNGGTGRDRVRQ